jgi:hypothetical protein
MTNRFHKALEKISQSLEPGEEILAQRPAAYKADMNHTPAGALVLTNHRVRFLGSQWPLIGRTFRSRSVPSRQWTRLGLP